MSFKSLGLSNPILKAVENQGYTVPSPIQKKAIPLILNGNDVLASAQTGTGKTAGFTLPLLHILSTGDQPKRRPIRALVLTPTRELAAQVFENVKSYSEYLDIKSAVIFGGVKQNPQVEKLRNGVDVLVATPGRLLDLINQRLLFIDQVEFLVLDEADRMLDMGFLRDIKKVLAIVPAKRQNLLFSATFSKDIKKLANGFMKNPKLVEATPENSTVDKIVQKTYKVNKTDKPTVMINMITEGEWKQVLIFTRTKHGANRLTEKLNKNNITAAAIHGNKSQGARTKALAGFKDNTIRVLVATDIAARGLDIPLLPYVVNYELPNVPEDYVHRIGRTGRAGESGIAISLVSHDEKEYVRGIEKLLGEKLSSEIIEGFEPDANPPKEEKKSRGGNRNSRPNSGGDGNNKWKNKRNPRNNNSSGDRRR